MKYLSLWLEAPLQSWGVDSRYYSRDSMLFPSKSGILGLLFSGSGLFGSQKKILTQMAPLKQTVIASTFDGNLPKLLTDFHMVGSGYDSNNPWQKYMIPKTSEGKKAVGGGAKLTYRNYIQDANFYVILEVPDDLCNIFVSGLITPVGDIFLGRKNCIPTDFIYRGVFDNEYDAEKKGLEILEEKDLKISYKVLDGNFYEEGDVLSLSDVPLSFGEKKEYISRRVTMVKI
jgi:CRISPR system Cascade subunit CasD